MQTQGSISTQGLSNEQLEHIALFPIPNAVFFPGTMLPLHVFEPRYRQMTREAIEDNIPIAVLRLKRPQELNALGKPAFHEIGGAGFLMHHQQLADGRYNILLEGSARIRILEERETDKPYRVGRAEIIAPDNSQPEMTRALLTTLQGCIIGLQPYYQRLSEALTKTMNVLEDSSLLADAISSIIISDPDQRQNLLEEPRVDIRLDAVIEKLTDLLATVPTNHKSTLD